MGGKPSGPAKSEAEKKAARVAAHHKRWATIKARRAADKDLDVYYASDAEIVRFVELFGLVTPADKRFDRDFPAYAHNVVKGVSANLEARQSLIDAGDDFAVVLSE